MNSQSQSDNAVGRQGVVVHNDYDDSAAYFNSLPPGFRFHPNDDELINHYLHKKIKKEPLPLNRIREVELYRHTPDYLAENYQSYGENQWYFFTARDRKYKNGRRPNRAAGNGYWKATGADKIIESNGQTVGYKKALVFYVGKAPKGDKSPWIMHEFRDAESESTPSQTSTKSKGMTMDHCVLCRMYKKPEKSEVNNTESQTDVLTENQTEDVDNGNGVDSDVGDEDAIPANTDPKISNSDDIGLINPSGADETLQYIFPPLPSEPSYMFTDNHPHQSNINFGYGDPNIPVVEPISSMPPKNFIGGNRQQNSYANNHPHQSNINFGHGDPNIPVVEPISFMPPTNFRESNHQQNSYANGCVYDDFWDFKLEDFDILSQYGGDFRPEDSNMLPQYGGDFRPEDSNMLPKYGGDFRPEDSNMLPPDFSDNFPPVDESLPNNTATSPRDKSEQPKSSGSSCK